MKSKLFAIAALCSITFLFSCGDDEKCLTCSYQLNGSTVELSADNLCGDDSYLDGLESSFKTQASAVGVAESEVNCSRD